MRSVFRGESSTNGSTGEGPIYDTPPSTNTNKKIKDVLNSKLAMFTGRNGKNGFRARARDALKGLTIDTKVGQDSYKAENPSITVRSRSNSKLAMSSGYENKKDFQVKSSVKTPVLDTKLAQGSYKAENAGISIDARLARKASNADMPRLSEAMMNRNWRDHRRAPEEDSLEIIEPPWSAPPEQSKFPDAIKAKPQRDDEHEIINYDRGLKRVAYRCRKTEDVKPELIPFMKNENVDPDLCLSAPATKTEFSAAEIGTEEQSSKYDPSVFQPSFKSIVRLNEMVPTKRAGYERILNWDEQQSKWNKRGSLCDSSSITTISLVDPSLSSSWETLEFPYAEIRAVRGIKRFETGLSDVEETIRNQLSTLVEPQSAGLPPEYLRKVYEEVKEERRKTMVLANSTLGTRGSQRGLNSSKEASGRDGANDTQFNALLGKLNKLCAPRIRAFTLNDKDDAYGPNCASSTEDAGKSDPQRSPSEDSGISGLSPRGRKRASTLNPAAIEFRYTTQEKQSPVTNECDLGPAQVSKQTPQSTDPIRLLETRVAELEAQLARHQPKQVHFAHQGRGRGCKMNQIVYGTKDSRSMVPGEGAHHPAMNKGIQGPTGYQPAHSLPSYKPGAGFAMGTGGMDQTPILFPGHAGWPHNSPSFPSNGANNTPAVIPFQGHGPLVPAQPASGTSLWVKSMFGPKPVSKPDRPFNPGDGMQAMRQQEYEEYLEHLRVTDPTYAQSCKQRQARRADRQRPGHPGPQSDHDRHGSGQKLLC
ncbi:hypothetical protein F4782DRAFT_388829 [Xylaria castorea]|nr:hypothetical protein F4782DRAFT_388829 [Xylaria castorea]